LIFSRDDLKQIVDVVELEIGAMLLCVEDIAILRECRAHPCGSTCSSSSALLNGFGDGLRSPVSSNVTAMLKM
jgi:hypothetical protein